MAGVEPAPASPVRGARIVDFEPRWREDFARLNVEWLERWFTVEPVDRDVLGDPERHILAEGGQILFAVDEAGVAFGTVALKHAGGGTYELTKMAVSPAARGQGLGRALLAAALARFHALGGAELFLESSSRLQTAIRLYERAGFEHRPAPRPGSHYARADVYMVWTPPAPAIAG